MTQGYRPARDLAERFWEKVDKSGECWLWTAGHMASGYGAFGVGSRTDGTRKSLGAHRVAYFLATGVMSDNTQHVHHVCENRECVRPSHLELVTAQRHVYEHDSPPSRNGRLTHCRKCGRELIGDNLIVEGKARARRCRHCRREYVRNYKRGWRKRRPWLPSARNVTDAARTLAKSKKSDRATR